jgi:hypothetical protein
MQHPLQIGAMCLSFVALKEVAYDCRIIVCKSPWPACSVWLDLELMTVKEKATSTLGMEALHSLSPQLLVYQAAQIWYDQPCTYSNNANCQPTPHFDPQKMSIALQPYHDLVSLPFDLEYLCVGSLTDSPAQGSRILHCRGYGVTL